MEIDTLPTAHAGPGTAASATKIEGVLSMEEFERGYQAEHAANKAAKLAPGPKLRAAPVAIGAHSSKHTQDLHQKYQKLNISQPVFKFEGSSDQGWKGQVGFPGLHEDLQDIKDDKIYSSKQQAKEELSGRALVILERLEKEGTVRKVESHSTKVSKYTVAVHDKAQKLGIPQPFFSYDGSTQSGWRATVSFPSLDEIKDLKDETYHANKSEAKESASKQVLATIQAAEADGMFQRFDKARGPAQQAPKEKEEPGENYVGQLLGRLNYPTRLIPIIHTNTHNPRIPARHQSPAANLRRLRRRQPIHMPPQDRRRRLLRLPRRALHNQKDSTPRSRPRCSRALQEHRRLAQRLLGARRHQEES